MVLCTSCHHRGSHTNRTTRLRSSGLKVGSLSRWVLRRRSDLWPRKLSRSSGSGDGDAERLNVNDRLRRRRPCRRSGLASAL